MKHLRISTCLALGIGMASMSSFAEVPTKYLKQAATIIEETGGADKKLQKAEYLEYIQAKQFKLIDTDEDEQLSAKEFQNAGLHCIGRSPFAPAKFTFKCQDSVGASALMSQINSNNNDTVNVNTLYKSHTVWKDIFDKRVQTTFNNKTDLTKIDLALVLENKDTRSSPARLMYAFSQIPLPDSSPFKADYLALNKVLVDLDLDDSGSIDQFEYLVFAPKTFADITQSKNSFTQMVELNINECNTVSPNVSIFSVDIACLLRESNKNVPRIDLKNDVNAIYNLYLKFKADFSNTYQNAKNKSKAISLFANRLAERQKNKAMNNQWDPFFYNKEQGLILLGEKDNKDGTFSADKNKTGLYLRVLSDFEEYDKPEKASFTWNKTKDAAGNNTKENSADIVVRFDFFSPVFEEHGIYPDLASLGIGFDRSGDGTQEVLNEERFLFIASNADIILKKSIWPDFSFSSSLKYGKQEARTPLPDNITNMKTFNKRSLRLTYKPTLNFLGLISLGKTNKVSKSFAWFVNPTFSYINDRVFSEKEWFVASDSGVEVETPVSVSAEEMEMMDDNFNYLKFTLETGVTFYENISLKYTKTFWEELSVSNEDFNYEVFTLEYKFSRLDNIALKFSYKNGIEDTQEEFAKIKEVGFSVLF